jgi:putative transposase
MPSSTRLPARNNQERVALDKREGFVKTIVILLFDRDTKFGFEVLAAVKSMGTKPVRTTFRSPWQNGVAERWVGSCRRDLLDHVIAGKERHLKRLLADYVRYYHQDRTHLGLAKQTPARRDRSIPQQSVPALSRPRLGGLHHRYDLAA